MDTLNKIKWAYQRVVRGYDDTAVWALDEYITDIVYPVLKEIKEADQGTPPIPKSSNFHTSESWNAVLDKMIFAFGVLHRDDMDELMENRDAVNEGLELFGKYYSALWT